ncbi:hypothetical protein HNY73_007473 [Argiope bruennichi]|uniref:Uncharacterized protein n=1 Tax=Argiope bruennichi TaxID=94029 RepID=A0A8T0FGM2_ARGBR|nr:hypothetical protein HNY73_007473 [Argiope bruennichi]
MVFSSRSVRSFSRFMYEQEMNRHQKNIEEELKDSDREDIFSDHQSESEECDSPEEVCDQTSFFIGKDKATKWQKEPFRVQKRIASQNIIKLLPDNTQFSKNVTSPIGSWSLLIFDDSIIEIVLKCTNIYMEKISGNFKRQRDTKPFEKEKKKVSVPFRTVVYSWTAQILSSECPMGDRWHRIGHFSYVALSDHHRAQATSRMKRRKARRNVSVSNHRPVLDETLLVTAQVINKIYCLLILSLTKRGPQNQLDDVIEMDCSTRCLDVARSFDLRGDEFELFTYLPSSKKRFDGLSAFKIQNFSLICTTLWDTPE